MKSINDFTGVMGDAMRENRFVKAAFSGRKKSYKGDVKSVRIKPVIISGVVMIQFESLMDDNKAIHRNLPVDEATGEMGELMRSSFYQVNASTTEMDYQAFTSRKADGDESVRIIGKASAKGTADMSHNRKKNYILDEEDRLDFLIELGICDKNGRVKEKSRDKFRQLNRYLEFIRDIVPTLDKGRKLEIIDFGCGKAYLSFALYHYLHNMLGLDVEITGLDLKKDVIQSLRSINEKIGFSGLRFEIGDIANYDVPPSVGAPDIVISLHACNTATDASLIRAASWGTRVILAVPCCQHEINDILDDRGAYFDVFKYGLLKDRFASILTDSLRALALEARGYDVQVAEFIDMEHTPKNVLIKGVRRVGWKRGETYVDPAKAKAYDELKKKFGIENIYLDAMLQTNIKC